MIKLQINNIYIYIISYVTYNNNNKINIIVEIIGILNNKIINNNKI